MGAIIGVVIGYVFGARAGEKGLTELRDAWTTITTSEEVRDTVSGGVSVARGLVGRGGAMLVERLMGSPTGATSPSVRRVA